MGWGTIVTALVFLIPEAIDLAVEIAAAVRPQVDEEEWSRLGPRIKGLVEKAMEGQEFTDDELAGYIPDPDDFRLRAVQARKRAERLLAGLPTV